MEEKILSVDCATLEMIDKAKKDGVETIWDRKDIMKTPCGFGSAGVCCRICNMGPCRVSPVPGKGAERGLCGATADVIVARNFARMCAGGASAHSDHGRSIAFALHGTKPDGDYKVRDEKKLMKVAKRFGIETEGRDIYEVAHELAEKGLNEFGNPFGSITLPPTVPEKRKAVWDKLGVTPRAIDRDVVSVMHSTHIGCSADADHILRLAMRASLCDGWAGSYMATEFTDIMFETPKPVNTEANLGVLEGNNVNILLHGHEPILSEMIVLAAEDPELVEMAKAQGADGINVVGMCCTGNEIVMRHGAKIAGNFAQQELAIITGAVEACIVDVQCIFPALARLSESYHTKFITTSEKAHITGAMHIEFDEEHAYVTAKKIVKEAVMNFKNRDMSKVHVPNYKSEATVGFSTETIINALDKVVNSQIGPMQTVKPLADVILSGVLRGAAGVVGCNNPKVQHDNSHITTIKNLIANDVIVVTTGCAAQAAAKAGLMTKEARKLCGKGLATVCELVDIPPVLHMGSCVDISRILELVGSVANHLGCDISDLPVIGVAPEWMSEKAVTIGTYVVGSGIDVFLGVTPPVTGGPEVMNLLTNKFEDMYGAKFFVEQDPEKASQMMLERIQEKRDRLGI